MGMFTTNLDKALSIPLGFGITSFGQEGGSETPRRSFQAKLSCDSVRFALLAVQGQAVRVPWQGSGVLARPVKVRLDTEAPGPHPAYGRGPRGTCWESSKVQGSSCI